MKGIKLKCRKSKITHKNMILIVALVLCLFIGIGFAYIQSSLSIHGHSTISRGTWDIHYENLAVKEGSVATENPVTISEDKKSISLSFNFTELNQYYVFEVDIVNAGEIDAMLDYSRMLDEAFIRFNEIIDYKIEFLNNIDLKPNAVLPAKARERVRITLEMKVKPGTSMYVGDNYFSLESLYVQATDAVKDHYRFISGPELRDGYSYGSSVTYDEVNDKYILKNTITSFSGIDKIMKPLYEKQQFLNDLNYTVLRYYDVFKSGVDKNVLLNEMNTGLTNINKFDSQVSAIKDNLDKNSAYLNLIDEYNSILDYMKTLIIQASSGVYDKNDDREAINNEISALNVECTRMKENFTSWELNYEKVNTYKYTCLNGSSECKILYVLYDNSVEGVYYRPYINGDKE